MTSRFQASEKFMVGRRPLARVLPAVLVPVMLFVALVSWALASPVGSSPDDDYHMASIWCGGGIREGLCETGDASSQRRVPAALLEASQCYAGQPMASASCPEKPSDVMTNTNRGNFTGGYPPVFYAVMSVFAGPDISLSITLMRVFNAFLAVALGTLLFFLLPQPRRVPFVWGGAISIVPLGMFLVPSVNPSGWAVISALTLWIAVTAYFQEERLSRRFGLGILAAVLTVVGAGARTDAAVYGVLAMAVGVVLTVEKTRRYAVLAILPLLLAIVSGILFLSGSQSGVLNPEAFDGDPGGNLAGLAILNLQLLPQLWIGALGFWGLGWLDTDLPGIVWVTIVAVFSAVVFVGVRTLDWRKGLSLAMVGGSLVVVPMYILLHDRVVVGSYVQPRYIYPLLIMFAGVSLFGISRNALSRVQLVGAASGIFLANAVALHVNIERYVTGVDLAGLDLDLSVEWWWGLPISPMGMWYTGTMAFGLMLAGLIVYSFSRQRDPVRSTTRDAPAEAVATPRL
ncbi:DUF2142 domain-containing protein [Glaciibacter sp. 2TAF33]|uniref:DUF2142 domain-containing protein n=1 Tax=Glaciibacter sp. 2TAF33 TaxID=3233015 RepID=UPI003F93E8AA